MTKILVVSGNSYARAIENLGEIVTNPDELFNSPKSINLVLFTGGEDITPELYGESSPRRMCGSNINRDLAEMKIFEAARKNNIRCIGICRGSQFLNVMAGGTMYHHVDGHGGCNHEMTTSRGEKFVVTSTHHQMVIPTGKDYIIGWSSEQRSKEYRGDMDLPVPGPAKEVESVLYPGIECAGAQFHPEYMSKDSEGYKWFNDLASRLINTESFSSIIDHYTGKTCMTPYQRMHAEL